MKTLIVYATTYGFTKDCVEELKKLLKGEALAINIGKDQIPPLKEFDQIVVGGSIYMGQLHKKLKEFCVAQQQQLHGKRLALFLCCGLPDNFEQALNSTFPKELLEQAITTECFGGELRINQMNFAHKMMTKLMKKAQEKEGKADPVKLTSNIQRLADIMNQ